MPPPLCPASLLFIFFHVKDRNIFPQYLVHFSDSVLMVCSGNSLSFRELNCEVSYFTQWGKPAKKVWVSGVNILKSCINSFHCLKISFWFGPFGFSVAQSPSVGHEQNKKTSGHWGKLWGPDTIMCFFWTPTVKAGGACASKGVLEIALNASSACFIWL